MIKFLLSASYPLCIVRPAADAIDTVNLRASISPPARRHALMLSIWYRGVLFTTGINLSSSPSTRALPLLRRHGRCPSSVHTASLARSSPLSWLVEAPCSLPLSLEAGALQQEHAFKNVPSPVPLRMEWWLACTGANPVLAPVHSCCYAGPCRQYINFREPMRRGRRCDTTCLAL